MNVPNLQGKLAVVTGASDGLGLGHRVGRPEDIGGAIATLLTGDANWITAQRIEVSGAMRL